MEFTTLTRRVAEATATDAAEIAATPIEIDQADVHGPDVGAGEAPGSTSLLGGRAQGAADGAVSGDKRADPKGESRGPGATPADLAAARRESAGAAKIDAQAYVCIRDAQTLADWVAEARQVGVFGFDTETTSLDPMQAELVGFSLATRPGRGAYVPVGHKTGAGDLLGGGLAEGQIPVRDALALIKPLLEDRSVLTIGQNLKFDLVVMGRYGVDIASYDDTMLLSYVLEGGAGSTHGMTSLADRWLGHKPIELKSLTGGARVSPSSKSPSTRPPAMQPRTPISR